MAVPGRRPAHPMVRRTPRPLALALLVAALLTLPLGSASAVTDAGAPVARIPSGRLGIGDSVMLGARTQLRAHGIRVDAVVSRQFSAGADLVRSMAAAGTLPRTVIVHLGNNGYLDRADCDRLVGAAGRERDVYLVSLKVPRGWRAANNRRLRSCVRGHDNAHLIGWYEASADHPGWFAADGYHLTSPGARAYAHLIRERV
jgi:hypothetical protein